MANSFYQMNNEILKIDTLSILSDETKIQLFKDDSTLYFYFNHWLMRRENIERVNNELDRGLFKLSTGVVAKEFCINPTKAKRLIKKFESLGIISCLHKSKSRHETSIYSYNSALLEHEKCEPVNDPVSEPVKHSKINVSSDSLEPVNEPVSDPSKKENKKENKKDIYIDAFTEIYNLWNDKKIIVHKGIKDLMVRAYKKALKEYRHDEIVKAINNYSEVLESDFYYSNRFTLENFLKQKNGISTFVDDGQNYVNYTVSKKTPSPKGAKEFKNNNYSKSICNNYNKNTQEIREHKFK